MAAVKPKIYVLEREIHMVGESVAVVWNTKPDKKTIEQNGVKFTAQIRVRSGDPYIDFVSIREYGKGEFVEDEDSPAAGGLSVRRAEELSKELAAAVEYLKSGDWKEATKC